MKKRGFTLIELLVIISLLALLAVLVTPKVLSTFNKASQKLFAVQEQEVEDAAKIYVEDHCKNPIDDSLECDLTQNEDGKFNGQIDIDTLINLDYIDSLTVSGNDCSGYISVTDDEVKVYLNCGNKYVTKNTEESIPESCFDFNSSLGMITGYDYENENCPGNLKIPNQIDGVIVKSIGPGAFMTVEKYGQNCWIYDEETEEWVDSIDVGLYYIHTQTDGYYVCDFDFDWSGGVITSVYIPNTIENIMTGAFENNWNLENLTFESNNNLKSIGSNAFRDDKIRNITIPASVTHLGGGAFTDNVLPADQAFIYARNADGSINNTILNSYGGEARGTITIPSTVKEISNWAFWGNRVSGIVIPDDVTTIGKYAFAGNQLSTLTLFSGLKTIDSLAFAGNQLASISIPSSVTTIGGGAFNRNLLPSNQAFIYKRNSNGSIDNTTLVSYGSDQLTNISIPSNVNTIANQAFYGLGLAGITIPNTVTSIGDYAFQYNMITQGNAQIDNSVGNVTLGTEVFINNGADFNTTITPTYLR